MNQDVSGGETAVEQPKNDFTSTEVDQVEAEAVTPAEPKKEEPPKAAEVEADSEDDTGDTGKKHRRGGFQKKISKLEAENAALRAQIPVTNVQQNPIEQGKKPDVEEFTKQGKTWEEYNEALTDWKIEQREVAKRQEASKAQFQQEYQTKAQRFEAQKEQMREIYPDFDEKLASYDGPVSQVMNVAILESEMSGEVLNYLGNHYDDAAKLASMNEVAAHKFVAKIEARIESSKSSKEKPAVKTTSAPPPVKPVSANSGAATKNPEEMSGDEFLVYERNRLRNLKR